MPLTLNHIPSPKDAMPYWLRQSADKMLIEQADCSHEGLCQITLNEETLERANLGVNLDDIPVSGGFRGGAGRNVLLAALYDGRRTRRPRDVDFIQVLQAADSDSSHGAYDTLELLAERLSPDDYSHGHGVGVAETPEQYMNRQDFTMNQLLVCREGADQWNLYTTEQAVYDTANNIIRPTLYEFNEDRGYQLSSKLALKALRLLSQMEVDGLSDARICGIDLKDLRNFYRDPACDYFMQLLQLDKALENGYDVAERYLQNLRTFDLHPYNSSSEDVTVEELYEGLLQTVDDFDMSDGARYSLDRGRRTARLTHRIGDYASRHA